MEKQVSCHVCGKENMHRYWSECGIGIVEDYYHCDQCGYFWEMAYSPYHEGIEILRFPKCLRQLFVLVKNVKKLKGLRISRSHF